MEETPATEVIRTHDTEESSQQSQQSDARVIGELHISSVSAIVKELDSMMQADLEYLNDTFMQSIPQDLLECGRTHGVVRCLPDFQRPKHNTVNHVIGALQEQFGQDFGRVSYLFKS